MGILGNNRIDITSLARKVVKDRKKGEVSIDLIGPPQVSLQKMKEWATRNGSTREFSNLASLYYKYGRLTGVRPEILYAQAAKSTEFGHFKNIVPPYFHNPFDLLIEDPAEKGMREAYKQFPNWDAGVRAHFNTICAFTNLSPVGKPDESYFNLKKKAWAGKATTLEDLFLDPGSYEEFKTNYLEPLVRL